MTYLVIDEESLCQALRDLNITVKMRDGEIVFYTDGYDSEGETSVPMIARF
jgi:hypothetical protein